jgi:hypothetical protein
MALNIGVAAIVAIVTDSAANMKAAKEALVKEEGFEHIIPVR